MPLKKFWKRIFSNNREIEFQALKSRSAVELSSYNRKPSRNSSRNNYLPRFYSHYDNLECAVPPLVPKQKADNQEEIRFVFKKSSMDQEGNVCIGFCHMETVPFSKEYLEESLNLADDSAGDGPVANPLLNEPTLNAALAVCYKFKEHPQFKEGLLLKSVESQSTYPYVHYTVFDQVSNGNVKTNLCLSLYRLAFKNVISLKIKQMNGVYEELSSMIRKSDDELNNDLLRLPMDKHSGYIIVGFKLLNYEQLDAMERNWLEWTGAKDLYKCSPKSWHLKRMTFHKLLVEPNQQQNSFVFVLFCEYENIMHPDNVVMGCDMVERLKQRYCGFVGLYKVHFAYSRQQQASVFDQAINSWETFGDKIDNVSPVISSADTNDTLLNDSSCASRIISPF